MANDKSIQERFDNTIKRFIEARERNQPTNQVPSTPETIFNNGEMPNSATFYNDGNNYGLYSQQQPDPTKPIVYEHHTLGDRLLQVGRGAVGMLQGAVNTAVTEADTSLYNINQQDTALGKVGTAVYELTNLTPIGKINQQLGLSKNPKRQINPELSETLNNVNNMLGLNQANTWIDNRFSEGSKAKTASFQQELANNTNDKSGLSQWWATIKTYADNPREVTSAVLESSPPILLALALRKPSIALGSGAISEATSSYNDVIMAAEKAGTLNADTLDIARRTALTSVIITLGSGKVASKLGISDLDAGKLSKASIKDYVGSMTSEQVEESLMAVNSTLGQNEATNQPLFKDLSRNVGEANVATFGLTTATHTPSAVFDTGASAANVVSAGIDKLKQVPIDRLLDPKDKKFDPAKAFSRAYELSINGETKEQKDTAKEQMDKAKSWVYDKLAEIDETIATTSTPEKLEKLHKQKELLQSKYIEPIENIIKAGNNASLATDSPLRPTDDGFVQDVLKNQEEIIAKFNSDNLNYGVTLPPMPSVPSVPEQEPLAVNPEQPTQSQPVNNNTSFNSNLTQATFFRDSIAVGYKQSYGANQGIVKGGKDTRWILNSIKDYVTKNPNSLQGQTVVLSSGYSNTSFGTDYKGRTTKNQRQTALANIKNQISTLKNAGANVVLLGVADNYNLYGGNGSQMNADLASLAKEQGVYFTGGLGNAKDRVHPNYPKNKIKLPNTNTTTQQNNQPAITKNNQTYQYNKKANRKTNAIGMAGNWNAGNIGSMSDATTRRFVASVLYNESAGGNINAVQPTGAYIGKYQLGAGWLVDAGYMSRSAYIKAGLDKMSGTASAKQGIAKAFLRNKNNWLNGLSYEAFMASHEHQDRAFKIGTENNYNELKRKGLLKGRSELEIAGLLKAAHLGGIGGATKVAKGLKAGKDFTGTSVAGYYNSIVQNTDGLGNQSIAYNGGVSNSDDSAVSTINQNTELDNTQEELNRLLAQWEQDTTNEALQDEIAKLQTKVETLSQKQNQEQIQTQPVQAQQQLDDLKAQTLPKLVIRYSQMASEQALDEINQLQQSGMLDEAQADNLRRLIDVKIAIKGTNQDDVNHQITKGRRGNTIQETNLGLEDYDKVFTSAIAGHTPDTKAIARYSRLLDNFSQSHHNKAQAMQEAYQSVRGTANSVYLIPTQTDNGVEWQHGSLDDFNKAKQQNAYPLQIHSGSGQFVDSVVQEALRIDGFKTAWADNLAMLGSTATNNPSKASKVERSAVNTDTDTDTDTVNVGRAGTGVDTVSLSNVNRGTAQAGQDGWLGNPFNIGAKGGWGVSDSKEQQSKYADLLIKVLKNNNEARDEFIKLQDKQLNSNYGEAEVIGGLLKAFKGKDDSQIQTLLNNYQGYDNDTNHFDFSPKQEQQPAVQPKQLYVSGTAQEAKANNGFFVGRGKVGGQFTSLSVAKRKQELIGKDGWLGNPFNKNAKDKRYQIKDNKESLDKYAKELKDFLLNNDKALDEFLKLQDVTLYKTNEVKNGATEADVVAQLLDALEGKTKDEAKQIIASVTGFKDGVLQFDNSSQVKQEQKEQTNDNNHREDKVLTPTNEAKRILQGKPLASVTKADVPKNSIKEVRDWAIAIFNKLSNKANHPILGEIGLTTKSVRDGIEHGKSQFKFAVFPALKEVLEKGALIDTRQIDSVGHHYISAPVAIDGQVDIVTVLVKTDPKSQRMYIHSVISKERLLTPLTNQEPQTASSTAQVKATSADIHNILHNLLTDKSQEQTQEKDKPTLFDNLNQQPTKPHNQSGDEIDLDYALADANREANDNRYDDDPFAHLTDEDVKKANEQAEQTKERELQRQADDWELANDNDNDDPSSWDNVDDYYQSEEGQQTLKESNQPNKQSLKGKVKVHEQTKEQQDSLTGVQPLSQVIDKLGLSADGLMIAKAINQLYDLKVSFDGTQGKDIIPSDKLLSHLVAYSTSQVLEVLKAEVDDKDLQKLKSDLSIIRQRLAKVKVTDKKYKAMISHALDNDVNLLGLAVSNKDFQQLLKQIEYNESIANNLFSKLVYGLMSVFGIANKTSVNNLYEKTLTTLGDLIEFQAIDNSSLKAGHLSVLQGVTPSVRQQELQKPIIGETADNYQNLIKAGIYQGVKKPLARIKNLSLKLAQEGLSALKEDITKPTDKQLAQLEHFLAFKEELADLLNQALPKQNYANWDFQDLKEALIRADNGDGRVIDDNLITAMALSAYDKIIADGGKTYHSRDDVAKLLGFNPEQVFIPNKVHFEFLHIHAQTPSFSADLGKQIMSALELKQGGDVPSETQDRLASSLGNWLVSALQIGGYVHITTMPVNEVDSYKALVTQESFTANPDNKSTMSFVSFTNVEGENKHDVIDEVIEVSRETGSYLADLFGIPSSKRFPSLKPNKAVKKSIRGTKQKVSSDQERKISQAQQEPIYINQAMNKVLTALGDDVVDKLLGATITEEEVNKLHISRRKGAIEKAQSIKRELDNHKEWSAFVGDRPFYDTITTAINNRMHYDSNVWNFQSSTIQRAFGELANFKITIPTQTLELVKDNKPTLQGLFIRAVFENAEGTEDFFKQRLKHKYPKGWTVDKIPSRDFMPVALEYINQPYINDAINAILKTQSNDTLTQTDLQAIERVVTEWGMGARSLRALMELGLFSQALSNKTDFVTSLGLGSDGVNNGIAIASVLMGIDNPLTLTQIGLLKQQGFGSYFDTRTDKHIGDYYESFGMELQKAINHAVQALDKEGLVYLQALEYLNNTLKKRATYKAIIIPFGYGAGFKRLKQAAAEQMLGDIISQMQDIYHSKNQAEYELLEHHLKVILGNGFKLGGLDKLLEFEFDKKQTNQLLDTHLDFLGEASENALNNYAGEFIKRRNTAIKLHESASKAFLTAKDMLLDKAQSEHQEQVKKQSTNKVQNKALGYATLSDKQLDELEKVLTPIRPKVQNIYSLHSDGENGIQLTKNERSLKDENLVGKTKQLHDGELVNRTTKLLTSFSTEIGNGVTPNSQTVQSTDSYISSEAMVADKTVSINVHDANIGNLDHYPKMAQAQNKAFFYGTASYHLGYENIKTVIDTLVGIDKLGLDDKQMQTVFKEALAGFNLKEFGYDKKADPVQALHGILSELIELQINQDTQKLAMYQSIGVVHQYAGEAGEYVLSEQDYEFLNQEEQKLGGLKQDLDNTLEQLFAGKSSKDKKATLQAKVNEFVDRALSENDPRGELELFEVSEKEINIARANGLDIAGLTHTLDANALKHAIKKHGNDSSKEKSQRDLTADDLKRIPDVLQGFDKLTVQKKDTNLSSLVYSKQFADGRVEYVERVLETSKKSTPRLITKTVWVKSATGVISSSLPQVSTPDRQGNHNKNSSNTQPINELVNHTGGNYGAELSWGLIGKRFGARRQMHYTLPNQATNKHLTEKGIIGVSLKPAELTNARNKTNELLGTHYQNTPEDNTEVLAYHQVSKADTVFVIASLTKDKLGVDDDTKTAVDLAIKLDKPIYLWDINSEQWHKFEDNVFAEYNDTPLLTFNFAGLGTRFISDHKVQDEIYKDWDVNEDYVGDDKAKKAKQAIVDVYQATKETLEGLQESVKEHSTKTKTKTNTKNQSQTQDTVINIWFGSGENVHLSNLAYRPFTLNDKEYYSVEHYYQTHKSGTFNQRVYSNHRWQGGNVKISGGSVVDKTNNFNIMKQAMLASFKQNPQALEALLATGNATLTHTQDKGIWKNSFPRLLMEVRDELANEKVFDKTTDKNSSKNTDQTNDNNAYTIDKILDKAKFKKRLDAIAQKADNSQKALYEMLVPLLPNNLKFASGTLSNSNAIAGVVGNTIIFTDKLQNLSDTDKLSYVNHELIHAVTEYGLSKDSKAKQDLVKMYEQLKAKANTANTQKLTLAFENINEFVAYGLTDKDVQQFILDNLDTKALGIKAPTKIKNALDNFLKAVFSLFGLNKSSSYKTFTSTVDKIIQEGLGKPITTDRVRNSQSVMKNINQNLIRGTQAMHQVITTKADVKRAMYRNDIGWIDFVWGSTGTLKDNGKTKGAMGISHIIEARMRKDNMSYEDVTRMLTQSVVETVALGETIDSYTSANGVQNVKILHNRNFVAMRKDKGSNGWIITAYELFEDGTGKGDGKTSPTHNQSYSARTDVGASNKESDDDVAKSKDLTTPTHNSPTLHRTDVGASDQDSITDNTNIRYAQQSTVDHFKQLDRASISDDFNNHLDKLIDRFISPYDKANLTKIDSLANKGLTNTKLLGLGLSTKEAYTTQALTYVFETYFKDNGALSSNRLEDLYKNAQKQFKRIQDLYPDYAQLSPQDKLLARNVYQYVFNNKTKEDNVARFMALVLASENFRQLIDSHKIQKSKENNTWFDKIMLSLQSVLDWFIGAIYASNQSNSKYIQGLLTNLAKLEANSRVTPLDTLQERYEQGFNFVMKPLNKIIKSSLNFAFNNELFINSRFGLLQTVGKAAKFANAPNRDEVASDYVARMQAGLHSNERMSPVMEALNELTLQGIRGKWVDTATRTIQKLGQIRQGVETETHRVLKASIKGEISKTERIAVTRSLLKTDLSSLLTAGFSLNQVINMLF